MEGRREEPVSKKPTVPAQGLPNQGIPNQSIPKQGIPNRGGGAPTKSFGGLPPSMKPGTGRRDPQTVGDILGLALRRNGLGQQASRYSGFHRWSEIVGEKIASVAEPQKIIRGNVLQVRVVDPVWAQELAMMKHDLVSRLADGALGSVIEDIHFITEEPKKKGS